MEISTGTGTTGAVRYSHENGNKSHGYGAIPMGKKLDGNVGFSFSHAATKQRTAVIFCMYIIVEQGSDIGYYYQFSPR